MIDLETEIQLLKADLIEAENDYYKKKGIINPTPKERMRMQKAVEKRKNIRERCQFIEIEEMNRINQMMSMAGVGNVNNE